ncbi:MAG: ATP-binding cassette domain-containing protein [Oscillospiraceae bacterium]|nr:ATP-binding cassette domain-containing protein [Oscillospiraceae bacterium]
MSMLVEARNLRKVFHTPAGPLHAVDGVTLSLRAGTTLGVVGESGCGKSTLGRLMLRLLPATSGEVLFDGEDVLAMNPRAMNRFRRQAQIIFQDPYASLNPRLTVGEIIAEPLIVNRICRSRSDLRAEIFRMMDLVGLADRLVNSYPHELDGGRRQRIGIARALVLKPRFLVCDEPVSALDVSIKAQILNLLMDLQDRLGLAYLFITHDLSVVKHISNEIAVMYLGTCVERAHADELFRRPLHPYTRALLGAIPVPDLTRRGQTAEILPGEVSSPIGLLPGCRFHARCRYARAACLGEDVALTQRGEDHLVACLPDTPPPGPAGG